MTEESFENMLSAAASRLGLDREDEMFMRIRRARVRTVEMDTPEMEYSVRSGAEALGGRFTRTGTGLEDFVLQLPGIGTMNGISIAMAHGFVTALARQ